MKILMSEIGIKQNLLKEAGYTLLDVLAAIAILGMVSTVVWVSLNAGYRTLVNSREQTWFHIFAKNKAIEIDCGTEKQNKGILSLPQSEKVVYWEVFNENEHLFLEVRFSDSQGEKDIQIFAGSK